ncbi:type II secretion system protein N [Sphingomonas sp. CROZ-RG-20F-R02-07]|uniref:type II secretion system protein N n=1 Tax=Sphingomonas sp. CROZ-RG-20F-R02-07 TaxID=2914832 RepID=UPI001F597201|nr:type II secretion system protein N [Sphingomonas sp. CROZ-RG-20F-R02-07]
MRLRMDARMGRVLARVRPANVYSLAELALLALLGIQAARLVWVVVTPVAPLGDWRPLAPVTAGAPIDILTGFDPFFRSSAAAPATVTALNLTLFGTRLNDATGRGSAIIAGADGVQQSVAVGEEIQPGVRLKMVAFDHVTIDRGGTSEDLFLDQSGAAPAVPPGAAGALPPPGVGAPPAPPAQGVPVAKLRQEIGFIPRIDAGRISGLVVRSSGSGALFRQAGLRDGDVVTSIGGRPVTGPQDIDRLVTDFAGGGSIPLIVERGRDTLPLSIMVAPSK